MQVREGEDFYMWSIFAADRHIDGMLVGMDGFNFAGICTIINSKVNNCGWRNLYEFTPGSARAWSDYT